MGYADISIERRIANIDDKLIGVSKAVKASRRDTATDAIVKGIVCLALAHTNGGSAVDAAGQHYPRQKTKIIDALRNPRGFLIERAQTDPARTDVPNWAGDLVGSGVYGVIQALSPRSVFSQLSAVSLSLDMSSFGSIRLPTRALPPATDNPFVGEGAPVPVRAVDLGSAVLYIWKCGVISHYTREILRRSVPSVESVLRQALAEDLATGIDAILLGDGDVSSSQPEGLLHGLTPLTASSATSPAEAITADLMTLASAFDPAASRIAYVMNPMQALNVRLQLTTAATLMIMESSVLPVGRVVAIDLDDLVIGTGGGAEISIVEDATIVARDDPTAVSSGGTMATPTTSLWQMALTGIRLLESIGWTTRHGRVSFMDGVQW
ncbi:phage major capsid protein [Phyllobacterium sp. SYP-B3895]|uniref:phage major capsid protein n=1 Tax=Phyllobacterium sp. SYP-B3895 TaxID=2663240 RepID=UPI001561C585|nr:phage major capsid protein [Phyllobacterium sp. SYP-B3895]